MQHDLDVTDVKLRYRDPPLDISRSRQFILGNADVYIAAFFFGGPCRLTFFSGCVGRFIGRCFYFDFILHPKNFVPFFG